MSSTPMATEDASEDSSGVDAILRDLEEWSDGINPDTFLSW